MPILKTKMQNSDRLMTWKSSEHVGNIMPVFQVSQKDSSVNFEGELFFYGFSPKVEFDFFILFWDIPTRG